MLVHPPRNDLRILLLAGASGLAMMVGGIQRAEAIPACTPSAQNITSNTASVQTNGGAVTIGSGVVVGSATGTGLAVNCDATTVTNGGSILGAPAMGMPNHTIGALNNLAGGLFSSSGSAISIGGTGSIGALDNAGSINGGTQAILLNGAGVHLGTVTNSGTITGTTGTGTVAVPQAGVIANLGGGIQSLTNTGTISLNGIYGGAIANYSGSIGSIGNSGAAAVINGGSNSGILNDAVNGVTPGNTTIGAISNSGSITGGVAIHNVGTVGIGIASIGAIVNTGTLEGQWGIFNDGTVGASITTIGSPLGAVIGSINNSGFIQGYAGISNAIGSIGSIVNSGTIYVVGGGFGGTGGAIGNVAGQIGGIDNSGTIYADSSIGIAVINLIGSIGTLGNTGSIISTGTIGVANMGAGAGTGASGATITALNNAGVIQAGVGVFNIGFGSTIGAPVATGATITALNNTGTISGAVFGVANWDVSGTTGGSIGSGATIAALTNSGMIQGSVIGIMNGVPLPGTSAPVSAEIGTLTNSGTIVGGTAGVANMGASFLPSQTVAAARIGTIVNSGLISGLSTGVGIGNFGTVGPSIGAPGASIGAIVNSGTITGSIGIMNTGGGPGGSAGAVIGSIVNSGVITGSGAAIVNTGGAQLGAITNTGSIVGNVQVDGQNLTIIGGSGTSFGALTGGTVTVTDGDLVLASGNQQIVSAMDLNGGTGTLVNRGNLLIASTVALSGNYAQTSGANLIIGLTPDGNGRLNLTGTASMAGAAVQVLSLGGPRLANNTRITVVDAATAAGTSYANVVGSGAGYRVAASNELVGGHSNLVLTLTQTSYTEIGNTSGARPGGMGSTLDQVANGNSPEALAFQRSVLSAIDALPPGKAQQDAVRSTAPFQGNPHSLNFSLIRNIIGSLIEARQLGFASAGAAPGMAAGSETTGLRVFAQAMGGVANRATTAAVDGYGTSHAGMMMGLEYAPAPNLLVGGGVSSVFSRTEMHGVSSGGKVNQETYQVTGYGTYWLNPRLFVFGQAGAGAIDYRQTRAIPFAGVAARSRFDGQIYHAKAGIGHEYQLGAVTLTPLVGLQYARSTNTSYNETGAGVLNLRVLGRSSDALTADAGARVTTSFQTELGMVTPEVRLAWAHDLITGAIPTSGVLAGVGFTSTSKRLAPNSARVNVATTLAHVSGVQIRLAYEGDIRSNYHSHTGLLRASMPF